MISWDDAQLFLVTAESGSFSAAAQALMLGQPTVSRRIAQLEEQLGLVLFHRGRRGTHLTADGERLVPHAKQMARWAAELEAAVAGTEVDVSGTVTIAAPPGIGADIVVPFARWLHDRLPRVRIALRASIEYLDLTRGQADLAFRTRPSDEPALVTLAELSAPVKAMVSCEYSERLGPCPRVADVGWIAWAAPYEHLSPNPELAALIDDFTPTFASDDYLLQRQACDLGLGAMFLPQDPLFPFHNLVGLDVDVPDVNGSVFLVCARSMRYVPRIRAVLDGLNEWATERGRPVLFE